MSIPNTLPPPAAAPLNLSPALAARQGPFALGAAGATRPGDQAAAAETDAGIPPDSARAGSGRGDLGGLPNPSIRMDPALGIVVLEFRDQRGAVRSIPTERELEAYRMAASRRERAAEAEAGAPIRPADPT